MKLIIKPNEKHLRKLVSIVVLAIGFTILNCEAALNCFKNLKPPELPNKQLETGYLGKPYSDELIPVLPHLTITTLILGF